MADDTDPLLEATMALVPALLDALDGLAFAGRHLHPPNLAQVAAAVAPRHGPLTKGLKTFSDVRWPEHLMRFSEHVAAAAQSAARGYDGLLASAEADNPVMAAYRSMRHNTRALEALYPVSGMLPPVSRFFLNPAQREDEALSQRIASADAGREDVGVLHAANGPDERGGFSLYVPEYYSADQAWPLVVALHGGSGHGRDFLWTWLRDARSRQVLVLSATSRDNTWSLMGPDVDSAGLQRMITWVGERYRIDTDRVLLTGMSDGGTFTWLCGLTDADAPYTHLAPISASFHPLLLEGADDDRLRNVPIYLTHGALDWMFPIDVARSARDALTAVGARLTYREVDDLSHTYPREENARILDWLLG